MKVIMYFTVTVFILILFSACGSYNSGGHCINNGLDVKMGYREPANDTCDIENIKEVYEPFINIEKELSDKKFIDECKEEFKETAALQGKDCFFISKYGICRYNIEDNKFIDSIQLFVFSPELEETGEIYLSSEGNNVIKQFAFLPDNSVILNKLSSDSNKRYVIITDGTKEMLLDSENEVCYLGAASSAGKFKINGDCFNALDKNNFSFSYNDIFDENNLFKIDF